MKNSVVAVFLLAFTLFACKKASEITRLQIPEDSGCIEWKKVAATDHSGHSINSSNIPIINALFSSNSINKSTYRYHYYSDDSVQTYFPPFTKFDNKIVRVNEFTNGLEIFNGELLFVFKNNVFNFQNGKSTGGTTLSTTPTLLPAQVRSLFLGHIEQFDKKGNQYKDSCFSAQFGYYNLNAGTSDTTEHLIKSWKVTLKNSIYPSEYPIAYYHDDDAKLIYYSNGIRSFR